LALHDEVEKHSHALHTTIEVRETSNKILDIIFDYALNKFNDSIARIAAGRPKFLSVIDHFVVVGAQVEMCLPAFPFKSANKVSKVLGILPDKAEELGLERLNTMCIRIGNVYPPGAKLSIISDGLVYNDLLGIPDRDTWAYGEALRKMAVQKGFNHVDFSRLKDLVNLPLPEKLEEISYVANATNFRRCLFNKYGEDNLDIDHQIATNPDTQMTYLGYRRFLESDLRYIFPLGNGRSNKAYKKDVKYLAKQMLIRGHAFAGAVKAAFPNHLRLSIHQSTGEHKVSMSLLNTKSGFTTPWHCSVALLDDGEWISATMGDFKKDPTLEIVYEDGRPSYFRKKKCELDEPISGERSVSNHQASARLNGHAAGLVSNTEAAVKKPVELVEEKLPHHLSTPASSCLNESEEEKITKLARTLSYHGVKDENGELINPFFQSEHPLLDPKSDNFSSKAWLETLMSITSQDPERYPKGVVGVAYKNLSAHGFGEPTDYQKTFGNYPFNLFSLARRLIGMEKKTRIQILRDFDGLVKSGEMLVVLGRPGRQVMLWKDRENIDNKRSGCSTLVKTISGETDGFFVAEDSYLNYQGIPKETMHKDFRGECIYQAEVDVHFPQLTVGQTLDFAARARVFDKVAVLYEGRQIYFGDIHTAKTFFVNLGFECPPRQTTADFLTSLTNLAERVVRKGFEGKTPYTPDEFAAVWQKSEDRARLLQEIEEFDSQFPIGGPSLNDFKHSRKFLQARSQRIQSPYTLSVPMQVNLCVRRGYQRLQGDMALLITGIIFNSVMALVVGSVFYNLPNDTRSLYSRGALLFFAILLAAFASALEVRSAVKAHRILTLYAQRPIVEKQSKYAFYHPFAEATGNFKMQYLLA
ncbi:MAG: hypothetical protein Q9188_007456, partial [Gyalolechia gomerana]